MGRNKNQPRTDERRSNHALHQRLRGIEISARRRRSEPGHQQNKHNTKPNSNQIQSLGRMLIDIVNAGDESIVRKVLSQLRGAQERICLAATANLEEPRLAFVGLSSSLVGQAKHGDAASLLATYRAAARQSMLPNPTAPLFLTAEENTPQASENGMHIRFEPRFGAFWLATYAGGLRREQKELEKLTGVPAPGVTGVHLASVSDWERAQFGPVRLEMAQVATELTHEIVGARIVFGALQVLPPSYSTQVHSRP